MPPQRGAQFGQAFRSHQAIEAGHEGILQSGRDCHGGDRPRENILPLVHGENRGFQHRLGHFFHKQRDAIAFLHEVLHDLSRERVAPAAMVYRNSTIWATWVRGSRLSVICVR